MTAVTARSCWEDSAALVAAFEWDWQQVHVVEISDFLMRRAAQLAAAAHLRSLDALHLAAAEAVREADLLFATGTAASGGLPRCWD